MADFWVIGPIAWDRVLEVPWLPPSGGFVQAGGARERPGGAGANTAIALASTGATVHMVGYVGEDEPGARLLAVLAASGVDTDFVLARPGHSSEVVILVEPSGERTIIGVHPDVLHTVPVPVGQVGAGDVVYFAAWHDEFAAATTQLTRGGAIVATVPPPLLGTGLPATYVIGSHTQYGSQDPAGHVCAAAGTLRAVVVTKGADGVVVHDPDGSITYPAQPVTAVDTTGAGDAFAAGFLHQVAANHTLADAAAAGIAWAAATVQARDSIPPPWPQVRHALAVHPPERS